MKMARGRMISRFGNHMRSTTKAIIGFGSILGLYALGAMVYGSFFLGANESNPEIVAMLLYGLTFLPACLLAIWFRKLAGWWLLCLFPATALGFIYQTVVQSASDATLWSKAGSIAVD